MLDGIPTLVCPCGNVMKAPGAKPGRVGKCPKCGTRITVRDGSTTAPTASETTHPREPRPETRPEQAHPTRIVVTDGGYGVAGDSFEANSFERAREVPRPVGVDGRGVRPPDLGPMKAPLKNETNLPGNFGYPFRSWSSVGLLLFLPPLLTLTTSPLAFLVKALLSDSPFTVPAFVSLIPALLLMGVLFGYVLIYLGDILIASATGDVIPPRPPGLDDDIPRAVARWFWAFICGGILGGLPAYLYWLNCGDVDWIDRLMFFNLAMIGLAYAQLALLATLLHDDPFAANPFTVVKAMYRLGWSYVGICLFTLGSFALVLVAFVLVSMISHSLANLILFWLFWVFAFYMGMVCFRRLGLYCMSRKLIQALFADRPRWGVDK